MKSQHGLGALYRHIKHPIKDTYELSLSLSFSLPLSSSLSHERSLCWSAQIQFKKPTSHQISHVLYLYISLHQLCRLWCMWHDIGLRLTFSFPALYLAEYTWWWSIFCKMLKLLYDFVMHSCIFHRLYSVTGGFVYALICTFNKLHIKERGC